MHCTRTEELDTGSQLTVQADDMKLYPTSVLFVLSVVAGSEPAQLLTYGPRPQTLVTLEGSEKSNPKVHRERNKRFLTFNKDASNIRIEMVFAIPFLQIPIGGQNMGGSSGSAVSPVVDVNAKSLIVASVLLFMLFFVIPKLVRVFIPTSQLGRGVEETELERVMRSVEKTFNVNATACWQQGVCSLVHSSRDNSPTHSTSSWAKVVDGLSNIWWIERLAEGTSLGEAMASAKHQGDGCNMFYTECPLDSEKLSKFAKELSRRYMNHLIHLYNSKSQV